MAATDATKFLNKTEYEIALARIKSYIDGVTPTKLSELTDDIVAGHYLPLAGGTITGALAVSGKTTLSSVLNITGTAYYSEGIRIHDYGGLSSVWFRAKNATGYDAGMWGISANDTGLRFRGPASTTGTSVNDYVTIQHGGKVVASNSIQASSFIKTGGTSSQFLKADGSVDSNSYLKTTGGTVSGNITATNFIKTGSSNSDVLLGGGGIKALSKFITLDKPYQMPTNPFGGSSNSIHQNLTNDGMYAASHRFNVTLTGITGNKNNLFDGDYESTCVVAAGGTGTILIESDTNLWGIYSYGYTFISFYYTFIPESVSMRFYGNRGGTVGWHDADPATFYYGSSSATSNIAYSIYNSNTYYVSKIEITIKAKSDKACLITQIDHMFTRGATIYMSAVTKFPVKQDLWGPVEINNTLSVTGNTTIGGTLTVGTSSANKATTLYGTLTTTGNITTSGYVAVGTGRNNGSYIASDTTANIYLHNSAGVPLVADGLVVRRGSSAQTATLGSTTYPWGGVYSTTGNFSDALTLSGTTAAARRIYFGDTSHYLELDSTGFHFSHGVYSDSFISAGGVSQSGGSGGGTSDAVVLRSWSAYNAGDENEALGSNLGMGLKTDLDALTVRVTSIESGYLPLTGGTMSNTNKVTNLNADLLDGLDSTDFARKFSYSLAVQSSVNITFTGHAMIIVRNSNNNPVLVLLGGGYGSTYIRNKFYQISTSTGLIHWRYHSSAGVQIINSSSSAAIISVLVTYGGVPTFTEVAYDTETAVEDYSLVTNSGLTTTLGSYLKLAGGTLTGPLKWGNSAALPATTSASYFLAIDAFSSGGQTKYITAADLASSIGLSNYLPLSGGTMTAPIVFNTSIANKENGWDTIHADNNSGLAVLTHTNNVTTGSPGRYSVGLHIGGYYWMQIANDRSNFYMRGTGQTDWTKVYTDTNLTKSVVTTLLGTNTYAPYNANGYLPLSGGTLTGNLTISKNSAAEINIQTNTTGVAALTLTRGTQADGYVDWRMINDGGGLYFRRNVDGTWTDIFSVTGSTVTPIGTITSNISNMTLGDSTHYWGGVYAKDYYVGSESAKIGSTSASNVYIANSSGNILVVDGKVVRRNTAISDVTLGNSSYPWGGLYSTTGDFSSNVNVGGTFRVLTSGGSYAKLLVYPTNPYGIVFKSAANGTMTIQSQRESKDSETYPLVLNPSGGNVGVGTSSPSYKLDVNGTTRVSGLSTLSGGIVLGTSTKAVAAKMEWDETNNAWKLNGNFYATGFVSAGGVSTNGGSGSGSGVDVIRAWSEYVATDTSQALGANLGYSLKSYIDGHDQDIYELGNRVTALEQGGGGGGGTTTDPTLRMYPTTTNAWYPVLTRYNTTSGSTYYTEYGRYAAAVTINPSNGSLSATNIFALNSISTQGSLDIGLDASIGGNLTVTGSIISVGDSTFQGVTSFEDSITIDGTITLLNGQSSAEYQYPRYKLCASEAAYNAITTKQSDVLYLIPE